MLRSIACTRARSAGLAACTAAGGVASTRAISWSGASCSAAQNTKSEPTSRSRIRSASAEGGGTEAACCGGRHASDTTSSSAVTRSGWRIAVCIADRPPAEMPITAARSMPSASSRHTCASACAAGEASAGSGVRR